MTPEHVETFFATLAAANPHPQTELAYTSVFELLAAVLLCLPDNLTAAAKLPSCPE